jgi:hypothetical protein
VSFVIFRSDAGTAVKVKLDAASPVLTGGFGGWEVVDRPKRVGMTRFKGVDPFRQDVAILFDGWATDESQESSIARLQQMALQPNVMQEPPTVQIDGMVLRTDLTWIIEGIDWDDQNVVWERQGTDFVRVRQAAVVHLLQFVDDDIVITAPSPAVKGKGTKPGAIVPVPQGMSLKQKA